MLSRRKEVWVSNQVTSSSVKKNSVEELKGGFDDLKAEQVGVEVAILELCKKEKHSMLKHCNLWKLSLVAAFVLLIGTLLAACVPADVTTNITKTGGDVAQLKSDVAALKDKIDGLNTNSQEPKAIERETKDQVIRGRADLLDYRMDYDGFKKTLDGKLSQIMGTPAQKVQGKPEVPAKPGLVESQLSTLRDTLAGTPAKKGATGKPDTPAKPGLLAGRDDITALTKQLSDIKAQLDRIEKSLPSTAAPAAPAATPAAK